MASRRALAAAAFGIPALALKWEASEPTAPSLLCGLLKMATYARVVGGRVMEVFTPPTGLTLANCFAPAIAAQFVGVPHDSPVPSDGWTFDGTTFAEPVAPTLTLVQQAAAAFAAGFHIVSTATPAVSGTYPLDPAAQVKIIALSTYVAI